ncbi:PVC-type heme-binding CxxCH protein [Cyclobacterium jeungdonense]|uniref:C-type cytochrome n=1 Tax=Cyclobacterium jeungdonense TaxID=708087 RepID=A0ABT8CDW0_9BACT|nr:PVC-type heme-binding CxxCH protein [Cyclobacterium jeungdonense]MDN3690606.1 c-type cytochrome [Cyclobacterium jeungdonense]
MIIPILFSSCQKHSDEKESQPAFERQENPVNSFLYTYPDSAELKAALAAFQLEPGLQIDLIAAEPLVADPAAFAFDEKGVMYVAENTGYPDPMNGSAAENLGKIARLEDRDGDGKYDYRTVFADDLGYPNGILPWKGGVFVTCAPHLYYLKDTNGNGKADIREIVLTGFDTSRTAQIRVSHPILGLDGWIYLTSGLTGGEVYAPSRPDKDPLIFTSSDSRFHPETMDFELTGGKSQFGLAFDAFGRRFGTSNRHPLQHIVLETEQLDQNPHLLRTSTIQNVSPVESEALVFPISSSVTTAAYIPKLMGRSHEGTFTSACGTLIYQSLGLSKLHLGDAFICEPAQNLVQRQKLEKKGASFTSTRVHDGWEFLSSTDTWFNPVFLAHGPGGALYLADMYRKIIDHPSYVPEEARAKLDFSSGKNKGRIYRISNNQFNFQEIDFVFPKKDPVSLSETLHALNATDAWARETAFRLLLESRPFEIAPELKSLVTDASLPETRVRAMWLLQHLNTLEEETLIAALQDPYPGVREQALWITQLQKTQGSPLQNQILKLAEDSDARVRFVAALVIGRQNGASKLLPLAKVAVQDAADPWLRTAVLSGLGEHSLEFLPILDSLAENPSTNGLNRLFGDLGELLGASLNLTDSKKLVSLYLERKNTAGGLFFLAGMFQGLDENPKSPEVYLNSLQLDEQEQEEWISELSETAMQVTLPIDERVQATSLLGYFTQGKSETISADLLVPHQPVEIQLAAVKALSRRNPAQAGKVLTQAERWKTYTPQVKAAVLNRLLQHPVLLEELIVALEAGQIAPTAIPSTARQNLMNSKNERVKIAANKLFDTMEEGGRMEVYEQYSEVLDMKGNGLNGKSVFVTHCSVCHSHSGEGGQVGPDLTGINNQPASALLLHTLVPNYEILPDYQTVRVETGDGKQLTGRITAESAHSLSIKTTFGTDETLPRTRIAKIETPGTSLMPDGLEQSMSKQDLADLIAFLKQNQAKPTTP